jgi:hypothetical protein
MSISQSAKLAGVDEATYKKFLSDLEELNERANAGQITPESYASSFHSLANQYGVQTVVRDGNRVLYLNPGSLGAPEDVGQTPEDRDVSPLTDGFGTPEVTDRMWQDTNIRNLIYPGGMPHESFANAELGGFIGDTRTRNESSSIQNLGNMFLSSVINIGRAALGGGAEYAFNPLDAFGQTYFDNDGNVRGDLSRSEWADLIYRTTTGYLNDRYQTALPEYTPPENVPPSDRPVTPEQPSMEGIYNPDGTINQEALNRWLEWLEQNPGEIGQLPGLTPPPSDGGGGGSEDLPSELEEDPADDQPPTPPDEDPFEGGLPGGLPGGSDLPIDFDPNVEHPWVHQGSGVYESDRTGEIWIDPDWSRSNSPPIGERVSRPSVEGPPGSEPTFDPDREDVEDQEGAQTPMPPGWERVWDAAEGAWKIIRSTGGPSAPTPTPPAPLPAPGAGAPTPPTVPDIGGGAGQIPGLPDTGTGSGAGGGAGGGAGPGTGPGQGDGEGPRRDDKGFGDLMALLSNSITRVDTPKADGNIVPYDFETIFRSGLQESLYANPYGSSPTVTKSDLDAIMSVMEDSGLTNQIAPEQLFDFIKRARV